MQVHGRGSHLAMDYYMIVPPGLHLLILLLGRTAQSSGDEAARRPSRDWTPNELVTYIGQSAAAPVDMVV